MDYLPTVSSIKVNKISSIRTRLSILVLIQMGLALIVIAWMNNGIFTYAMPYVPNYIRWGLFVVWFGLALSSNKKFAATFVVQCGPLLFFLVYILLLFFFTKDLDILLEYIKSISYLIMVSSIFLYYAGGQYRRYQKVLVIFIFFDCIFLAINTYIQLQMNPLLARFLATGIEARERLLGTTLYYGVGSYGYFYALVSIILLLGFLFLNYPKRKLIVFVFICLYLALLIKSSFTIAILFTAIFLTLLVILKYTNKYTFVYMVLLGVMSILIFRGMFASMFSHLANIKGISPEISIRFDELTYFFSGIDILGTDLKTRQNLYSQSMDAFANNILMGTLVTNSIKYSAGGHSAWLDLLARFGLFSIPFFVFLLKFYQYIKIIIPNNFKSFVNVYWLYFLSLGFVNTLLFPNIYTVWFLFLPMVMSSFFEISKKSTAEEI